MKGKFNQNQDTTLINEKIRAKEVLVIGPNGEQVGVKNTSDALILASAAELDLVLVAPLAKPPVCKIMNYGKYRYELQRKTKDNKKNQKIVHLKEIRLSTEIGQHDFETKKKHAIKFLEKGDKVKITLRFRGRQMVHTDLGMNVVKKFGEELADISTIEKNPKLEGRSIEMILVPNKK